MLLSLILSLEGPLCVFVEKTRAEIPFQSCLTLEITLLRGQLLSAL